LYLGEINSTQELAWRRSMEVIEAGTAQPRTLSLFPEDRCEGLVADGSIVRLKLSQVRLRRPRQWGACWLALELWRELGLDRFSAERLDRSRKGGWDQVLFVLVAYRLLAPGSEWRLHREWFERTALADLLDAGLAESHKLYRCHDRLLEHKPAVFEHLIGRWRDLFNVSFEVLLYDLTSTYFESDPPFPEGDKRWHGYSRDHRSDCVQVIIALVVTPEGLPLAYEVLPGNTADKKTLKGFLDRIERQYGRARRIWLMDRGVPTEAVLAEMRIAVSRRHAEGASDPAGEGSHRQALAGRPARCSGQAAAAGWRALRLRPERRPRRQGTGDPPPPAEMAVGPAQAARRHEAHARGAADAARRRAQAGANSVALADHRGGGEQRRLQLPSIAQSCAGPVGAKVAISCAPISPTTIRRGCGACISSSSASRRRSGTLKATSPFGRSSTKSRGASRRTFFIAFLAYCLHLTLGRRLHALAPGLTPRSAIEKFAAVQMIDLHVPTTDGRELLLTRFTEPEPELALLLHKLKLFLPEQPKPKITAEPDTPT
jgi:hypothetical protein